MLLYRSEPIKANEGERHKNAPALDIIQLLNKMKNSIFCTLHSSVGIGEVTFIVILINGITKVEYSGRLTDLDMIAIRIFVLWIIFSTFFDTEVNAGWIKVRVLEGIAGKKQRVRVRGQLMCGKNVAKGVKVKLMEKNKILSDDTLAKTETDLNGTFSLVGSDREWGKIEPRVEIQHKCEMKPKNCLSFSRRLVINFCPVNHTNAHL
uniref:Carboxypeptidase regulatory-like domain-containing protein n=1 Tax=Romanomermis culicivorax TaxID=13658 RepID=A0A915K809_ROMCU